jgi:hypothetical protein
MQVGVIEDAMVQLRVPKAAGSPLIFSDEENEEDPPQATKAQLAVLVALVLEKCKWLGDQQQLLLGKPGFLRSHLCVLLQEVQVVLDCFNEQSCIPIFFADGSEGDTSGSEGDTCGNDDGNLDGHFRTQGPGLGGCYREPTTTQARLRCEAAVDARAIQKQRTQEVLDRLKAGVAKGGNVDRSHASASCEGPAAVSLNREEFNGFWQLLRPENIQQRARFDQLHAKLRTTVNSFFDHGVVVYMNRLWEVCGVKVDVLKNKITCTLGDGHITGVIGDRMEAMRMDGETELPGGYHVLDADGLSQIQIEICSTNAEDEEIRATVNPKDLQERYFGWAGEGSATPAKRRSGEDSGGGSGGGSAPPRKKQ